MSDERPVKETIAEAIERTKRLQEAMRKASETARGVSRPEPETQRPTIAQR